MQSPSSENLEVDNILTNYDGHESSLFHAFSSRNQNVASANFATGLAQFGMLATSDQGEQAEVYLPDVDPHQQASSPCSQHREVLIKQQPAVCSATDDYHFPPSSSTDTDPQSPFMPDVAIDVCPGPDLTSLFVNLEEVDVYRGREYSSADTAFKHLDLLINSLPDLVIGKIFEFLYWKEKIYSAEVFISWDRVLQSPLGWQLFENDRGYAHSYQPLSSSHYVLEELACIAQYGQYFCHCIIWIHNFLPMESPVDTDFTILKYIELHCTSLKSLSIYHPPNLSASALTLSYVQYIAPLQTVLRSERRIRLHMYHLLYSCVESNVGAMDLLYFYNAHNILKKLTTLDISHGLILAGSVRPLSSLIHCTSLQTLKCPVQNVTTTILQHLLASHLLDLYLVNDEHTLNLNYVEKSHIRWAALKPRTGTTFNVHYIFKNRTICPVNMCPNPYVRSLVLDSLCSSVSRALLRCIADTYSTSLRCLAFILSVWEPLVPFSDLEDLANSFQYLGKRLVSLRSVILNLIVPREALLALSHSAPWLQHLLVYQHKIFFDGKTVVTGEQLMDLRQEISAGLKRPWMPVAPEDSLYRLGSPSQMGLLFEESVNQWEGFW